MMFPLLLLELLVFITSAIQVGAVDEPRVDAKPTFRIPAVPPGMPRNPTYQVEVREPGGAWQQLSVYNVKVGHQADEPLRLIANPKSNDGPLDASLVLFDFDTSVEIKITYTQGEINDFAISPASYGIHAQFRDRTTVTFAIGQQRDAPRKIVFRVNGSYDRECLHILTNTVETEAPDPTAANVLAIQPGEDIPRSLPEGKDVYYFHPGMHTLPIGAWVELDLGEQKSITSFDLETIGRKAYQMPGGLRFRIESRRKSDEAWTTAYESLDQEEAFHLVKVKLRAVEARFVRLVLLGNHLSDRARRGQEGNNYPNSAFIKQFTLYDARGDKISQGKAIAGAGGDIKAIIDANGTTAFGGRSVAEAFLIPRSGIRLYLAPGSVLRGAIGGRGLRKVRIDGRGILDGSLLSHDLLFREGRTSSIHIVESSEIEVEGITILDAAMWSVILNHDQQVSVRNVNILNSMVNADGIHFSATRGASATGCFMRACDDLMVLYHYGETRDIQFRKCVLWSDGGRAALFGMGDQGDIRSVRVEDCDLLAWQGVWNMEMHGGAFMVWPSGGRLIEDVTFKDIRLEAPRYPALAGLFQLKTVSWNNLHPGRLNCVRFENISHPEVGNFRSRIVGADREHAITDVKLHRIRWGQDWLTSQNANHLMEINDYVRGLVIE